MQKAFSEIQGQFMQVLLDKMKHDQYWDNTGELYDPLTLTILIDKKVLAGMEY